MSILEQKEAIPFVKKWIVAMRPWALPASTMPVIFGTSLAVVFGYASLDIVRFLLALLAMVILHSASNILSDIYDFKRGLDTSVTPVSGALVRGWINVRQAFTGSLVLFTSGCILGIVLVLMTGRVLLIIGVIGVAIGVMYTFLKYHVLGDLAVFLNFGILGSLGAWIVQTKTFSWLPVIWTVSMAMLVSAILHANNWRDAVSDREKKVFTVAGILGDRGSLIYYGLLLFGSIAFILLLIFIPRFFSVRIIPMPLTFLLSLLALPNALKLWRRAVRRRRPRHPMDFAVLDGATAQQNLVFGLLCTAAVWFHLIFRF